MDIKPTPSFPLIEKENLDSLSLPSTKLLGTQFSARGLFCFTAFTAVVACLSAYWAQIRNHNERLASMKSGLSNSSHVYNSRDIHIYSKFDTLFNSIGTRESLRGSLAPHQLEGQSVYLCNRSKDMQDKGKLLTKEEAQKLLVKGTIIEQVCIEGGGHPLNPGVLSALTQVQPKTLILSKTPIASDQLTPLRQLEDLDLLSFSNCTYDDDFFATLADIDCASTLWLGGTGIDWSKAEVLLKCRNLQQITITGCDNNTTSLSLEVIEKLNTRFDIQKGIGLENFKKRR